MAQNLITIKEVKELTAITDNVDEKHILPHIVTTQQLKIMPRLGAQLLNSLLDSVASRKVIANITQANPAVATTASAHGFTTGDKINITGAAGMEVDGNYTITVLSGTTFEIDDLDSTALPAYDGGSGEVMAISPENMELYLLVRSSMAWYVQASATPYIHVHITNAGLTKQAAARLDDGNTATDAKTVQTMKGDAEAKAMGLEGIYLEHLRLNKELYPLWIGDCLQSSATGLNGPVKGRNLPFRIL